MGEGLRFGRESPWGFGRTFGRVGFVDCAMALLAAVSKEGEGKG